MKYVSTRGGEFGLNFEDVLFQGYAKDGGLYFPEEIPHLSPQTIEKWRTLSYWELMFHILRLFIDKSEVTDDDLRSIVVRCEKRTEMSELPVAHLKNGLNIIELFHGPTKAFKDLAMSIVSEFLSFFLEKRDRHVTILVGTSGDTGGSAAQMMKGMKNLDLLVLYPKNQITQMQEMHMVSVMEENIHVFEVEGTSDDLDAPIKKCFDDTEFASRHDIISVNSINWVRICAQMSHYFYTYYKLSKEDSKWVDIIVPTGAAGNITAGCIARKMGLPIRMIAAVNDNDIVHRCLKSGDFSICHEVFPSLASAMNIQAPYNMERILYLFSGCNSEAVKKLMKTFETDGNVHISDSFILSSIKEVIIDSHAVSNREITSITEKVYKENDYVLCPHTAVGASYFFKAETHECPQGILATASPVKFPKATKLAGAALENSNQCCEFQKRTQPMTKEQDWLAILKSSIESISANKKN